MASHYESLCKGSSHSLFIILRKFEFPPELITFGLGKVIGAGENLISMNQPSG